MDEFQSSDTVYSNTKLTYQRTDLYNSQDISVHIPLHRLLSMLLQKAMKRYFCESEGSDVTHVSSANSLLTSYNDFFEQALRGSHPYGFSAYVMEHPLRIRVFCAEVHAGMWLGINVY